MTIDARFRMERGAFTLHAEFSIPSRGVTAIFGPSGSGKTTLLRAMAGLEKCDGAYLRVGGSLWQERDHFLPAHKRSLGYVFQEASLFPHLTVKGNLEFGLKRVPQEERRVTLDEAVSLLGIQPLLDRQPMNLSGGERQRVAIARALLTSPRLLLMDEPLAALDEKSKAEIIPYLEKMHRELEIPILYVSHSSDEVARLADHIVLMEEGKVIVTGPIKEILTRTDLSLAHEAGAEAIIEGKVRDHDEKYQLNFIDFPGGSFTVAGEPMARGRLVRLRILARDVSLAIEKPSATSILNIFHGKVEEISRETSPQVTVRLTIGEVVLLSRVTRKSAESLGLEANKEVFVQVKSVALLT